MRALPNLTADQDASDHQEQPHAMPPTEATTPTATDPDDDNTPATKGFVRVQVADVRTDMADLRTEMADRFADADRRIEERFRQADAKTKERFRQADAKTKERFDGVEKRFEGVDDKFRGVEKKLDELRHGQKSLEAMLFQMNHFLLNKSSTKKLKRWHIVTAVLAVVMILLTVIGLLFF